MRCTAQALSCRAVVHASQAYNNRATISAEVRGRAARLRHLVPMEHGIQVDAVEGDVVVQRAHGQAGALEDVILADLQQRPVGRDAAHGRLKLVIRQRVQRQVHARAACLRATEESVKQETAVPNSMSAYRDPKFKNRAHRPVTDERQSLSSQAAGQ